MATPPRSFWIISGAALLWNLIGVVTFISDVTMSPEALAALPEAERMLYESVPLWATIAYGVAVFAGVLGSIALLMKRAIALPLFVVSLVGILVQMGQAILQTDLVAVRGMGGIVLPVILIVIGIALVWYASQAKSKGWLA